MSRCWDMPSKNTFQIPSVNRFIHRYYNKSIYSIDPFSNSSSLATVKNDLDGNYSCDYNMDALDFLKMFDSNSVDLVFFDPPYSPRQVSECYKMLGKTVTIKDTMSSFWSELKNEISRIVKPNGIVLSFSWNSNGIGKNRGFEILEVLNVAHGGQHNDTICVAERKFQIEIFSYEN
jgi:hypothetical protein